MEKLCVETEALRPKRGSDTTILSSGAESSEHETTPPPRAIAAGDNTIPVKQASVPGTSPNKESTHLKIRGPQLSNHAVCSEDNRNENQDHWSSQEDS